MTGRSHRLLRSADGGYRLVSRAEPGVALANLNLTERARFQRGEKVRVRVRVKVRVRVSSCPNLTLTLTLTS